MNFPYHILAHGSLGWWDELVFLGIVVIFVGLMIVAWFRSRDSDFDKADLMPQQKPGDDSSERFELE